MRNPPSPQRVAILAVLDDGDWHDRADLIAAGAAVVPPGKAYRYVMARRARESKGVWTYGTDEAAVQGGQRKHAGMALATLVRSGVVERDGDRFRMTQPSPTA